MVLGYTALRICNMHLMPLALGGPGWRFCLVVICKTRRYNFFSTPHRDGKHAPPATRQRCSRRATKRRISFTSYHRPRTHRLCAPDRPPVFLSCFFCHQCREGGARAVCRRCGRERARCRGAKATRAGREGKFEQKAKPSGVAP